MLSSVINSLRVFRGLYDLAFSEDQFYVEKRKPFKFLRAILMLVMIVVVRIGGH